MYTSGVVALSDEHELWLLVEGDRLQRWRMHILLLGNLLVVDKKCTKRIHNLYAQRIVKMALLTSDDHGSR